jgi:hypothetical protein
MHAHHYFRQLDGQITMEGMKAKAATTALILGLLLSASAMMIAEAAAAEPAAGGTRFCNCLCECVPHCKLAKVCIFKCVVTCSLKTKLVEDVPLLGNNFIQLQNRFFLLLLKVQIRCKRTMLSTE